MPPKPSSSFSSPNDKSDAKQIIVVGVGNSSVQIGRFSATEPTTNSLPVPLSHDVFPSRNDGGGLNTDREDWNVLGKIVEEAHDNQSEPTPWYIASVFDEAAQAVAKWVQSHHHDSAVTLLANGDFPIEIATDSPERVGTDRIAAATAVSRLKAANHTAIFVDAGTALTVNAVSATGQFLGGAILPGTTTSGDALKQSTDQLPRIVVLADKPAPQPIGRATNSAIASGIYWGAVGAVKELIERMTEELQVASHDSSNSAPTPELFVTGGFGPALAEQLGTRAQSIPHLVISGIALAVGTSPDRGL